MLSTRRYSGIALTLVNSGHNTDPQLDEAVYARVFFVDQVLFHIREYELIPYLNFESHRCKKWDLCTQIVM